MLRFKIFILMAFSLCLSPSILLAENATMNATNANNLESAITLDSYDSFIQVENKDLITPGWIQFNLQAKQGITALITANINQGNLDMAFFDQYGNNINASNNVTNGTSGIISYTPTVSGIYYLRVDGDNGARGNYDLAVFNAWFNPGITDSSRDFFRNGGMDFKVWI